jgi:hypothetical protein
MRCARLAMKAALLTGAVAIGLGVEASSARAQVPGGTYTYGGRTYTYYPQGGYYARSYYSPYLYYYPGGYTLNGYNPGPVGPGPTRDWSTGRGVPLAKPWMRPLPR